MLLYSYPLCAKCNLRPSSLYNKRPAGHRISTQRHSFTWGPSPLSFSKSSFDLFRPQIEYNRQKVDIDARMTKALITNLRANSTYEFRITCLDSGDGGPRHRLVARTAPSLLNSKPELDVRREPDNTVTIILPQLETRDTIKWASSTSFSLSITLKSKK